MSRVMSPCTSGDVGHLAVIVLTPEFGAVGGAYKVGLNGDVIAMLHDAAREQRTNLKRLTDFLRIVLLALVAEDGAARHYFQIGQLGKRADQAFGETVAEVFVVRVGGRIDEGQNRDGVNLVSLGVSAQEVCARSQRTRLWRRQPRR